MTMFKVLTLCLTIFAAYSADLPLAIAGDGNAPAGRPPCQSEDFRLRTEDFVQLNAMIDLAMTTGQVGTGLKAFDPLVMTEKRFSPTNFTFLFMNFSATPVIKSLSVKGLSTITPDHFNVTSATSLNFGGSLNGTLDVDATLTLEVVQTSHKKWHLCWTDFWHPKDCPPSMIPMTFNVSFLNPEITASANVPMLRCPAAQADGENECNDLSINDMLTAILLQNYQSFLMRLLRRIVHVDVTDATFNFDQMTELNFHLDKTDDLRKWISDKIYGWSQKHLNKHSTMYNTFVKTAGKRVKEILSEFIADFMAPFFGATCYDT